MPAQRRQVCTFDGGDVDVDSGTGREEAVVRHLFALILALPLLAGGCVLFNPTDPYAGMGDLGPDRIGNGLATRPAAPPAPGPLSLAEAIRVALANNPEVAATAREEEAAAAQRDAAAGQRWPNLHAVGGYSHFLDSQRLIAARENGEAGVFSRDLLTGDLVVTLPLFTGGRITSEIRAAELLRQAAEHRLVRTREELVFNVTSVFYGILAQRRVIESLESSQQALQEHLKRVQDLIAAQKAARVDQLRTEVRLADLEQRLAGQRNLLDIQGRVFSNLLGLEPGGGAADPKGPLSLGGGARGDLASALRSAHLKRSDVLAARATLEAQARAVDAARAGHWPTVALQGTYGGRWAVGPTEAAPGADRADDVGRLGVVVDVPLFEGGRIAARVRQERARLLAAQERLRKLGLQVQLDVETAILNIDSAFQRVEATQKAIEQAKESLRIEREKYDLGKGAIVDVLDAQSALLDSQTNYYRALADYNVAQAQLRLAVGEQ
jgi:outer membrane protein